MSEYFIQWKGSRRGPFSADEITALIQCGEIGSLQTIHHGKATLTPEQFMASRGRPARPEDPSPSHEPAAEIDWASPSEPATEEFSENIAADSVSRDGLMVFRDGQEMGRMNLAEIQTGLISGRLRNHDTIWDAQSSGWLPVSRLFESQPSSRPTIVRELQHHRSGKFVLIAGYVAASFSVLFLPLLSGLIAFLCGIYILIKGRSGHGTAIIGLSILCTVLGSLLGEEDTQRAARHEMDLPSLREFVKPAVVQVNALDAHGEVAATGSGFFVEPGVIVTNYHVVEGASDVSFTLDDQSETSCERVLSLDSARDLAILQPTRTPSKMLQVKNDFPPREGDKVAVIGSPLGFDGTLSDGIVSALRESDGISYIQITAAISPGSSGSPVVNSHGEVVGIATAIFQGGQSLNFAVSSKELATALKTTTNKK